MSECFFNRFKSVEGGLNFLRSDVVYILIFCILTHGLIVLNDGFFWDDNIYYGLIKSGRYEEFSDFIMETGLPLNIYFFRGLDFFVGIENHRWVSFFSIFASAILLNKLLKLHFFEKGQSISLIYPLIFIVIYPFRSTVLLCTTVYQVMLLLFILAIFIRLRYAEVETLTEKLISYIGFSILSFLSFNTASILPLYYFYLIFECCYLFESKCKDISHVVKYIRLNAFFIGLPIIYWVLKILYFPTHGEYENYNKINIDFEKIVHSYKAYLIALLAPNLLIDVLSRSAILVFSIVFLPLSFLAFPRLTSWMNLKFPSVAGERWLQFIWLMVFLFMSAFPYSLININPAYRGFDSRHLILFTLSLPAFVVWLVIVYVDRIKEVFNIARVDYLFRAIFFSIVIVGIVESNAVYMDYQALAIKQESVIENLRVQSNLKKYSIFEIDDQVGDFSKNMMVTHEVKHQAWYEWAAIFKKAWGEERWYGNNLDMPYRGMKSIRYGTGLVNENGANCRLILRNNMIISQRQIIYKYWLLKHFGSHANLRAFLLEITSIEGCQ